MPDATEIDQRGFHLGYVVARLDRLLKQLTGEQFASHGLTVAQYLMLSVLRQDPGLSNAQLARRAFMSPQAMNELLAKAERDGLIQRKTDQNHRRVLRTSLTPRARKVLVICDQAVDEVESRMLVGLIDSERDELMENLVKCVQNLGGGLTGLGRAARQTIPTEARA